VPRAAWLCAAVACLNAVCWSFITPPFQVPDEPDHFAYVEQLALTGHTPSLATEKTYSSDEALLQHDLGSYRVRLQPENTATLSPARAQQLALDLAQLQSLPIQPTDAAGVATAEPPLYYGLALIPYELGSGGTLLERLQLIRLLGAAFAGLTALMVFLFVREALPGTRWAWPVAGMAVALTPLLGFMSGAVTPESLFYAVAATNFYVLARAFRRGFTASRGAAVGAAIALGVLTKLNFMGFVPGLLFGLGVLLYRLRGGPRARARRALGATVATIVAFAVVALASGTLGHSALLAPRSLFHDAARYGSLFGKANYIWQFYLPRLPGMPNDFPGIFTPRQIWFDGLVGLYGWLDTTFPNWVYELALVPAGALALLLARELLRGREALRARIGELLTYALMAAGLLILVGSASYPGFPRVAGVYAQSRYLLPLLALMGASLALAVRTLGPRWGPALGAVVLVLFFAHDLFSQLQVIARYYG
jgi:hypothetical protein